MTRTRRVLTISLCLTTFAIGCVRESTHSFGEFVDRYLDDFARRHPSIAAGNGLHQHDDRLDDFSATAIAEEIVALKRDSQTLAAFDTTTLTPDERVDRLILLGVIDGWLLEQETLQNWKRNPMLYASALSDGVHNLMAMESDAAPVRMRRIISKLQQAPDLLAAARANLTNPPRLLAERGAAMTRGAVDMLGRDLDLAFASDSNVALRDSLRGAADVAIPLITAYVDWLERDVIPNATGEIAIGAENVARRYLGEDLIDAPLDTLLAIGERELVVAQQEFREAAAKLAPGRDPLAVWREVRRNHPQPGGVVAATRVIVDSLAAFVERKGIASLPANERVIVEPALPFDIGFASMHASPPLETTPVRSVYYITEPPLDMPKAEADAWLERYNYASLENTSAHEAIPGHWLHSVYMRRTPGKVRRIWIGLNPFPQPSSGQDGWAHYAEQMILDEGFADNDPRYRLAQLSDALTRICRLLSGIRVHSKQWTLEDAQRCFEERAYVAAPAAKREAERAVYDPTYGGYFLGKRGFLKLRADYQAKMGAQFNLREFHERVMSNGIAPIRAHRMLMLPGDTGAVIR
ncbi:MAG TPA: DUF885 domain-containing protein [Vicinamibacterales bacterium]|nr:DUF885 domain-containing protein [Vicinamibacterales bacterium]